MCSCINTFNVMLGNVDIVKTNATNSLVLTFLGNPLEIHIIHIKYQSFFKKCIYMPLLFPLSVVKTANLIGPYGTSTS